MIELTRYYENAFFPIETSEGNFVEGTDRHIALFETNNPGGIYTGQNAPGQTKTVRSQGWSPLQSPVGHQHWHHRFLHRLCQCRRRAYHQR
jgi:hypothetical protein